MSDEDPYTPINLGQKRKLYNECSNYGITNDQPIISMDIMGDDVDKLLSIDNACAKPDLRAVLNYLTGEDMFYVSRTIKQSTWMINHENYVTIFHPEYLQTNTLPKMTIKAANKLMKNIRLHLKDESRVEAFYNNEKDIKKALKWLPNCSVPFIEREVTKHAKEINMHLLKRLSEKSTSVWKIYMKHKDTEHNRRSALSSTFFILYKDTDQFMDVIEKVDWYEIPSLKVKGTQSIMKTDSRRVIEKIDIYITIVDIPTFANYLKEEEVTDVLYKVVEEFTKKNKKRFYDKYSIFTFDNLKCFIQKMAINQRYQFVKEVFIDKIHSNKVDGLEVDKMAKLFSLCEHFLQENCSYVWYEFAPFEEAFPMIKDCIAKETRQDLRNSMLVTLLTCARSKLKYIKDILQYFNDKLINDKLIDKQDFIHQILSSKKAIHKYDEDMWTLLHEIFKSIDVYKDAIDVPPKFIEALIVYNIIKTEKVPEILEKKFIFDTLRVYANQMNQADKDKLFTYLYNYSLEKLENCNVDNEPKFKDKIELLYKVLLTLKDWKKNIVDYPIVLDKIRECINIKSKNAWKTDLSKLYNINKSWKKHMFEESLRLHPSEEVCLNALKHDARLLKRNENEILNLSRNDKVSLQRFLSKLRIFWPQTLAKDWAAEYLSRLNQADGLQALVCSLCAILPLNQLLDIIKTYAPDTSEINWEETDSAKIGIQRNIAKNMHKARPQPSPESILLYAKGDYLQYALPSILSIFYNLNVAKTREIIPRLFDAPVSLQKHGLRLAIAKMQLEDILDVFKNVWKTSKNYSIRSVIFKLTFDRLCKEKDTEKAKALGDFLNTIVEDLSFEEDSTIYELLGKIDEVPISVRPSYIEKSYRFLQNMLPSTSGDDRKKLEGIIKNVLEAVTQKLQYMCPTFVTNLLLEFNEELNNKKTNQILHYYVKTSLLSKFLLMSDTEEKQNEKFNTLCKPFIKCAEKPGNKMIVSRLQDGLRKHLLEMISRGMVIPEKLYSQMHEESRIVLPVSEHYILLTELKLFAALMKILNNLHRAHGDEEEKKEESSSASSSCSTSSFSKGSEYLKKLMNIAGPEFGKMCASYLREDIETHFPLIYELFTTSLINLYDTFTNRTEEDEDDRIGFCTGMLEDKDFIQAYLVVLKLYLKQSFDHERPYNKAILKLLLENESVEVRMHYNTYAGHHILAAAF